MDIGTTQLHDIVRDGDYETVLEAIREHVVANLADAMKKGHSPDYLYVQFLHTALQCSDDRLELVARVCIGTVPSSLLSCYLVVNDDISRKVAHALAKVSDLDKEMELIDACCCGTLGGIETSRGRQRLEYLKNSDV